MTDFFNSLVALFQEYKTEKSLKELEKLSPFHAKVIREGSIVVIPASNTAPGDIVLLEYGDRIPADIRILESYGLSID